MSSPVLRLTNVRKSFGAVRALKGVAFSLNAGEVHALVGENGAGKSTLVKLITGALQPDDGSIEINGQVVQRLSPRSAHALGIAAIYQQPALFPDLTVAENIAIALEPPAAWRLVRWADRQRRAAELLDGIGARISPEIEVKELSMPEQQLVEIAKALGAGAKILIMDEPTASLTSQEVDLLFELVRNLRSQGVGIIYISHRLDEVFQIADRVTVLRDGESVGARTVSSSAAQPQALSEAELIRMMVGREISTIFPPPEDQPKEVVLDLRGVGCDAAGIREVTLDLRVGEVLGLAGLVGAGRTELARILFGITPADRGTIVLDGKALTIRSPSDAVEAGVAYLPEDRRRHGVVFELSIAANISMANHRNLFPTSWLRFGQENLLAAEYIRELGIKAPSAESRAGSLSGGNQQKVALARWLAVKPKVLILDEPTQGVDVGAKAEIHKIIRRLTAQGVAVMMISSDLPEILGMSDRIAVMRGGSLVAVLPAGADARNVMAAAFGTQTN